MSRPEYLNFRITEHRTRWLDALLRRLELEPTPGNYTIALDYALMTVVTGAAVGTIDCVTDRTEQVAWIEGLASSIVDWMMGGDTAQEAVEYARSEEGTRTWDIIWPVWFDDHDERVLVEYVERNL